VSEKIHRGGCHCGAVRFEAHGDPKFVSNCHCHSCRKTTGAAFSTWIGFPDGQVRWVTERSRYAGAPGVDRGFCAACGTPLSYASDKWPGETHFLIGVMDRPEDYAPTGDAFAGEALAWAQHMESRK